MHTAHESAGQIRARAEEGAASVLSEATEEAARLREDAEMEAARRRSEAAELSENEINVAKEQGRQMVNEARAYRERVLGELARRRDMARDQIDQLVHHRDQLLNAFIHARDVAGSVIGGLGPIDVPDDFVDLSPTTGPVSIPAEPDFGANGSATGEGFGELSDTPGGPSAVAESSSNGGAPVVALFPERESGESGETITEEIPAVEPDAATVAQVDSLFAKLRAEGGTAQEEDAEEGGTAAPAGEAEEGDTDDAPATPFERRDAELTPLIVGAARRLKRVLADEQNDVLDTLRQGEPVRAIETIVHDETQQIDRYLDSIGDDLEAAARAGASSVSDDPDAIDLAHSGALGPVRDAVAGGLITPLRERLAQCIDEADGDNDIVMKRVRSVYREWKTQHIDTELDDVFCLAYGRGVLAALPTGAPVTWIVDPKGPACPDAEDNSLAGEVGAGEPFPTGHVCAPAHAGCRCLLAPSNR